MSFFNDKSNHEQISDMTDFDIMPDVCSPEMLNHILANFYKDKHFTIPPYFFKKSAQLEYTTMFLSSEQQLVNLLLCAGKTVESRNMFRHILTNNEYTFRHEFYSGFNIKIPVYSGLMMDYPNHYSTNGTKRKTIDFEKLKFWLDLTYQMTNVHNVCRRSSNKNSSYAIGLYRPHFDVANKFPCNKRQFGSFIKWCLVNHHITDMFCISFTVFKTLCEWAGIPEGKVETLFDNEMTLHHIACIINRWFGICKQYPNQPTDAVQALINKANQ